MKKVALILLLSFSILTVVLAQNNKAQKIDEFGNLPCDDYLSKMDNMLTYAQNSSSVLFYILIYEGKENLGELLLPTFGSARAKIRWMNGYIIRKNFPIDRFTFVEAGFREKLKVEFWLVPSGAKPPKPTPTLTKMRYRRGKPIGFCEGFSE